MRLLALVNVTGSANGLFIISPTNYGKTKGKSSPIYASLDSEVNSVISEDCRRVKSVIFNDNVYFAYVRFSVSIMAA